MPELGRKTPCIDCPFRKNAAPGWLGASTADEFLANTLGDAEMPCHMAIDYSDPMWDVTQLPDADLCVGGLQFQNNFMKLPRPRKMADACRAVGTNDKIMSTPAEFLERHDNDMNRRYVEAHQEF